MNHNIINPHKYKKITRSDKLKKDKKSIKNIKNGKFKKNLYISLKDKNSSSIKINRSNKKNKTIKNKMRKRSSIFLTLIKVACSVLALVIIGYISGYIVDSENNPILNVFKNNNNEVKLVANYDFKIGINNLDYKENILINELYKYSYRKLVTFDEEYNIVYGIAKKINKIDEKTYEIEIKDVSDISDVIYTIEKLKSSNNNRYYKYLNNISSAEIKDISAVKLVLKNPDPYIVYSLDFNIEKKDNSTEKQNNFANRYNSIESINNISFLRNDEFSRDILKSISFSDYIYGDSLVSDFRNNLIDMFLTSSEEYMRLIGKHEYNVKKYRNGETYFLFGNKNSKLFSLHEVRKAIAYSLNRNEIAKGISSVFTEVIDIPYIYSNVSYKYDIYGAENYLVAESWNKSSGIYSKKIDGNIVNLELALLVNIADTVKINIAENIKRMLENVGIRINILKLSENDIKQKIASGEYDIVLSNVYINNNPNISYLDSYININENINEAISKVNTSSVDELSTNIRNLKNLISSEIACIGIAAKNTNVVYQKNITGFDILSYMNVFKDIDKIGKFVQ